eukprot:symbB.v1.2.009670.t1/scaffold589.1/size183863/5
MAPKHGSLWAVLLHTLAFVADGQSCAELPEASSLAPEYSASRSSCLVQRRVDDKKTESNAFGSPFSLQQQQCVAEYVSKVRTILPDYNLTGRRFGGKIGGSKPQHPPILGAGFGSTATRSLTAFGQQLGLKVHHYFPGADKRWQFLDDLLTANCTSRAQLDETDFQGLIESGPGAVIPWKPASVIQHDLCRHLSTPQSARCTGPSFTWDCDSLAPHDPSAISILKNAREMTESLARLCLPAVDGRTPDVIGYTYGRAIPGFLFCIPGIKGDFDLAARAKLGRKPPKESPGHCLAIAVTL